MKQIGVVLNLQLAGYRVDNKTAKQTVWNALLNIVLLTEGRLRLLPL
ncbi:MAG: hypothetical protein ABJM63_02130 [Anderseniella sp.]